MNNVFELPHPASEKQVAFNYSDELLTVEDMSLLLKTSETQVRRLCSAGKLPAVHIGRRWYVHRDKLAEMLGVG